MGKYYSRTVAPSEDVRAHAMKGVASKAVWPIAVALFYYLCRRLTEEYYSELGVPPEALDFNFADYLFANGVSLFLVLPLAIVLGMVLLLIGIFPTTKMQETDAPIDLGRWRKWLGALAILFLLIGHLTGEWPGPFGQQVTLYIGLIFVGSFLGVLLLLDDKVRTLLKMDRRLYGALAMVLALLTFSIVQQGPELVAESSAHSDTDNWAINRNFYAANLIADEEFGPDVIKWTETGNGQLISDGFFLLLESNDQLWLRSPHDSSVVFSVPKSRLNGVSLQKSE